MASKVQTILELSQDTMKALSDSGSWRSFLRSAAWQYKYPFDDQVLIYAQRPDATACARIEVWNNSMHRWINKGARGIALLRENGSRHSLEYVFDVSDTNDRYNRDVRLWRYNAQYDDAIIETLESTFGELNANSIYDAVIKAARNAVQDNKTDYLHDLKFVTRDSFLRGLDDVNLDLRFRQTAENSVAYMVMQRMGLNPDSYFDTGDFEHIRDFNTFDTMNILGNAVSSISETALRNISETIRAQQKFFAKNSRSVYNRNTQQNIAVNEERNDDNGRDSIQDSGRLSASRPEGAGGGNTSGQVRNDETELSQEQQAGDVLVASDAGQAVPASAGDRQDSDGTGREHDSEDGGSGRSDGGAQSYEPIRMDRIDEQLSPFGGGIGSVTTGVQLNIFDMAMPSEEEQRRMIAEAEQRRSSAFSLPQQIIDEVITSGSGRDESILNICIEYSKNKSSENNIDFLKNEYGIGGRGFIIGDSRVSVWWNDEGMKIAYGDNAIDSRRAELIAWDRIDNRIKELLELGRFAPQETLDMMRETEYKRAADSFWYMHQDVNFDDYPDYRNLFKREWFQGGFPDSTARIAEMLKNPEQAEELLEVTSSLNDMYADSQDVMRWKMYTPDRVLEQLSDLSRERLHFTAENYRANSAAYFITQDEISDLLIGRREYRPSKIETYLFFQEHSDINARVKYLREKNGIQGAGYGYLNYVTNNKGITLKRAGIASPLAKLDLTWRDTANRIDRLIKDGKYFTQQELDEYIPKYRDEQEQRRIYNEKSTYIREMDKLTPEERRNTLPKRVRYFLDVIDDYELNRLSEFGLSHLEAATELDISEAIMNDDTRKQLADFMRRTGGAATDVVSRNGGYRLSEELNAVEVIHLNMVGDFYEVYGDEAVRAADILQLTLGRRHFDSGDVAMVGMPRHAIERYANELTRQGVFVAFPNFEELEQTEQQVADKNTAQEQAEEEEAKAEEEPQPDVDDLIGRELEIAGRLFVIEAVREMSGDVSMRDVTFQNNVGFPINRVENIDTVRRMLEQYEKKQQREKQEENIIPVNTERPKPGHNTVVYPEIPMAERNNFRITDDELGYGTASQKYQYNVDAIKTLKRIESEHRLATPEEQEILSRYVGWGGLPECFEEGNAHYAELKSLLTDDEFTQARASTLNAHYTSPTVIKAMYKALENMGFKQGNILEPSCGIGNFMGLVPESMNESKIYGIELDSITGRIAQQLYQRNSVAIQGFEESTLPDSFFDAAIGNVPFGNYKILEKKYDKNNFLIHDFFFAKTLDKVRPGGVVAFITSKGTLDKHNSSVRRYIAQRADLIGAIRLPNNAFLKNAGTQVTSDIIFLQKRDRMTDIMPDWVQTGTNEQGFQINQYFIDNPDMILGELTEEHSLYAIDITCKPYEDVDLAEQLEDAIQNIHAQITEYEFDDISNDESISIPADPNVKNFSYTLVDGDIYFRENSAMTKVEMSLTAQNRVKGLLEIRECVRELIELQTEDYPNSAIKEQQKKLNKLYDEFTAKYGLINSRGNNMAFSADSSYFLLCSLEIINDNGELERKADMFTKRTIGAKKEITKVDTASEALAVSIGEKARIDMEFISQLTGKTEQEIFSDLKGVIFLNPLYVENNVKQPKYLTADEYLSGNVRQKLEQAKRSAEINPKDFNVNVEALEKVQPKDLSASEITVRLGTTWIPPQYIKEFIFETLSPSFRARTQIDVYYSKLTSNWNISGKSTDKSNINLNPQNSN